MNDTDKYPIFTVFKGELIPIEKPDAWDNCSWQMHHYIKKSKYDKNKKWYEDRGIKQKLILMPYLMHQHLENPVYKMPDKAFEQKYGISKSELLFNRKTCKY